MSKMGGREKGRGESGKRRRRGRGRRGRKERAHTDDTKSAYVEGPPYLCKRMLQYLASLV